MCPAWGNLFAAGGEQVAQHPVRVAPDVVGVGAEICACGPDGLSARRNFNVTQGAHAGAPLLVSYRVAAHSCRTLRGHLRAL